MLGYMTAREALKAGFTHHGKIFFIPIWITDEECPMVAAKWSPLEYLITPVEMVALFIRSIMYPEDEPTFVMMIGAPIEAPKE